GRGKAPGGTQAIVRMHDHESADVREAVLRAIAARDPEAARELAAVVLSRSEPAWNVRLAAVETLIGCDGTGGARSIIERCLGDEEPLVREAAVIAIPAAFGPDAAATLVRLLEEPLLRTPARHALESMGPEAAHAIVAALDQLSSSARQAASFALGTMHTTEACSALEAMLNTGDAEDRWNATLTIVTCGCVPAESLVETLPDGVDETVIIVLQAAARRCSCACG
ncbi:MAG: HEAT repeat domain-containing protein, partial [Coriobacteriia bacterium]|nr:HEAT repeat domain-containing protein [Coriobacteriia bacterium]